ncbi:DUF2141 domain-containing protein [Winogradskyella sp.]|uniref:DUF2141 domain-containing protein n=1 Tax=Winogradskyella sp. TaxID=1883156 RepID=UPI00263197CD|nr:DUF2141 domain-containing protein [Winogradskyella sp.]
MKTRNFVLTTSLCFIAAIAFAQETASITVQVNDIKNSGEGHMVFMLFNKDDGFPKERQKAFKLGIVEEFGNSASYTFKDVPYGNYAVSVHQDKDADGEMKSNFIGMPKEPVGASNMTKMGKPNFKKCSFEVDSPEEELDIKFIIGNK